jgi:serine/threonine protein kinase
MSALLHANSEKSLTAKDARFLNGDCLSLPLTEPLTNSTALAFSNDRSQLERPFTEPLSQVTSGNSLHNSSRLERPNTQPLAKTDAVVTNNFAALVEEPCTETLSHTKSTIDQRQTDEPDPSPATAQVFKTLVDGFREDALALREDFILDEILAVGGSSIVYKAHSARHQNNETPNFIAIKTLRPELRHNADAIERLRREFRYTTSLNHPNIAQHFSLGQVSNTWFITMAYLDGQTLAKLLEQSQSAPLLPRQALAILKASADALSYAHQHGVVHGDMKPGNMWLTPQGNVIVIDFGAAQCVSSPDSPANTHPSKSDEPPLPLLATPAYASPQVLEGHAPEQRDDVFSVARVAYELLGGDAQSAITHRDDSIAANQTAKAPTHMSPHVWNAIERGLHPDSGQRTATVQMLCNELRQALDRADSGDMSAVTRLSAVNSQPPASVPSAIVEARRIKTSRANVGALSILVALTIIILFIFLTQRSDFPTAIQAAVPAHDNDSSVPPIFLNSVTTATDLLSIVPPDSEFSYAARSEKMLREVTRFLGTPQDGLAFYAPSRGATFNPSTSPAPIPNVVPRVSITLAESNIVVSEHAIAAVLILKRIGPSNSAARVRWRTIAGSAKPDTDYQHVSSGVARFAEHQTVRTLYVPLNRAHASSSNRSFEVELHNASAGAALGDITRAVVTIQKYE